MFRRWVIVGVLGCSGLSSAEPWPAVPADKPAAETVYVMRTAGQNDRQLKVIRAADPTDPASMAEVKDMASGQTFVIPGKVLAKLPKAGATAVNPPAADVVVPTSASVPNTPPDVGRPSPAPEPVGARTGNQSGESPDSVQPSPPVPLARPEAKTASPVAVPTPPVVVAPPPIQTAGAKTSLQQPDRLAAAPTVIPAVLPTTPRNSPPQTYDPWRASGEAKVVVPTPLPTAAGPRLTPVPSWRAAPKPTPPGVNDPWRPSGG